MGFETPVWEIATRATAVYFALALVIRLMPKRQTGDLAPNDLIALIVVAGIAGDAIKGDASTVLDLLLMVGVILMWDYTFNLLEYYFPRLRAIAQDSPTVLVRNGRVLEDNLRKEKLTKEELDGHLRKGGVLDVSRVAQATLEVDGKISVVRKE